MSGNLIFLQSFLFVDGEDFGEPLQAVEKSKLGVYVATKAGRIFKLRGDVSFNCLSMVF